MSVRRGEVAGRFVWRYSLGRFFPGVGGGGVVAALRSGVLALGLTRSGRADAMSRFRFFRRSRDNRRREEGRRRYVDDCGGVARALTSWYPGAALRPWPQLVGAGPASSLVEHCGGVEVHWAGGGVCRPLLLGEDAGGPCPGLSEVSDWTGVGSSVVGGAGACVASDVVPGAGAGFGG